LIPFFFETPPITAYTSVFIGLTLSMSPSTLRVVGIMF